MCEPLTAIVLMYCESDDGGGVCEPLITYESDDGVCEPLITNESESDAVNQAASPGAENLPAARLRGSLSHQSFPF